MESEHGFPPIEGHAVIGDGRSLALVSRTGSIDFLCWPRPDSDPVFAAILDPDTGGRWQIAPSHPKTAVARRYVPQTNVLETSFETPDGRVVLTDLMPVMEEEEKRGRFFPEHEIVRVVECERGAVEMEMTFNPRPGFGLKRRPLVERGSLGIRMELPRGGLLTLRTEAPLSIGADVGFGRFVLRAGESMHSALTWTGEGPAVLPLLGTTARTSIARSVAWWRHWAERARYEGPAREQVVRSALALKLLAYAPSGAILAAGTSSLPEKLGGSLNWDYRFCWLRDASLTVRALAGLGYLDEAADFVEWLIHARHSSHVHIVYDLYGCRIPKEVELPLEGYADSRPVRRGNAARRQRQMDVFGEVVDAAASLVRARIPLDRATRRMLISFGEYVARKWRTPDHGMWETRGEAALHTHSLLLCWVTLDRLLDLAEKEHLRVKRDLFAREREAIRRVIEEEGFNERLGAYTGKIGGDDLDASTLLLPWYGFRDACSDRMRSTWRAIDRELGRDALIYRHRTGESPGEGAFVLCSFWGAEYLALGGGEYEEARRRFESLVGRANDVGLFAEEIDPESGRHLGNFPQGFSHVGLINAALSLEKRARGETERPRGRAPHAGEVRRKRNRIPAKREDFERPIASAPEAMR